MMLTARRLGQLLAQLADEDVDNLQSGLVHAAIEMIEEHLLGQRRALPQREQFEHLIFLPGQMHRLAVDLDGLGIEIDLDLAGLDDRLGMAPRAPHDGMDAGHQFLGVERLGQIVVRPGPEGLDLFVHVNMARKDQGWRSDLGLPQLTQHVVAGYVWQIEVEDDQVVIVQLAKFNTLFALICCVDVEVRLAQHRLNGAGRGQFVLNKQNAHIFPLLYLCVRLNLYTTVIGPRQGA